MDRFRLIRKYGLILAIVFSVLTGLLLRQVPDIPSLQSAVQGLVATGHFIGQIFLRLIIMTVVPMVFSALVAGAYDLGQQQGVGRIARLTLGYSLLTSIASVLIGVTLVNWLQPGIATDLVRPGSAEALTDPPAPQPLHVWLLELIPTNPVEAAAQAMHGQMVSLMVFALLLGWALSQMNNRGANEPALLAVMGNVYDASMQLVTWVMKLAPLAIFGIVTNTTYQTGVQALRPLLFFAGVVLLGLLLQQFLVYSTLLALVARLNPWRFFYQCREVYLYAFSTASSNATLPTALLTAKRIGLNPAISRFVLTIGSTANQHGSALFEGVTVLFLAQAYGVDLTLTHQIQVVLMCILGSIGTAGVPGGTLPMIMVILKTIGVPTEGVLLIMGIDRFLDMCRTTLNVSGDLVIAALVDEQPKASV